MGERNPVYQLSIHTTVNVVHRTHARSLAYRRIRILILGRPSFFFFGFPSPAPRAGEFRLLTPSDLRMTLFVARRVALFLDRSMTSASEMYVFDTFERHHPRIIRKPVIVV